MAEMNLATLGFEMPTSSSPSALAANTGLAELRATLPTWRERMAQYLMNDRMPSVARENFVRGLTGTTGLGEPGIGLVDFTPLGTLFAIQEAYRAGDPQGMALAVAFGGAARGVRGRPLSMSHEARMRRSKKMGYSETPFYRGERDGAMPQEFPDGAFFSRQYDYAQGFARKGGRDAPEEYRLNLQRAFNDHEPVTAEVYARLVNAASRTDPELAEQMVHQLAKGKTIEWFNGFARHYPEMTVAAGGDLVRYLIQNGARKPSALFARAGFDALDMGRDVLKLTGQGIRSKDAKFDPARVSDTNIKASLAAVLGAGGVAAANYPNPD